MAASVLTAVSDRRGAADICSFAITSPNGANGMSDIEGKVTRVGASERGQRTSFKIVCCNFCKRLFLKAAWRWVDRKEESL